MSNTSDQEISPPKKKQRRTMRSKEFRSSVASTFSFRLNDNLCEIIFGYETAEGGEEVVIEETKIILTPRSLKILNIMLENAIPIFEQALGGILLPAGKEDELKNILENSGLGSTMKK